MEEIMTWHTFTEEQLLKAKDSLKTESNNKDLRRLVAKWMLGEYDEDMETLVQKIENLIP